MNMPRLMTDRLILRKFSKDDNAAAYEIFSDEVVNRFLPWFPVTSREDAAAFLKQHYLDAYDAGSSWAYAICLKENNVPIGYIGIQMDGGYDLGYGLQRNYWGKGYVTEAGQAVLDLAKSIGLPFVTATHDIHNLKSGKVMQRLGMTYRYSYKEQWQPKDILVTFRMYQIDFAPEAKTYVKYWEMYPEHFVETV